jgi:hypothetical protein
MAVSGSAAYGMYPRNVELPEVVCRLNREGFGNQDICMVLSPEHPVAAVVRDANLLNSESNPASARTLGWVSGFGAVVIPTVGLFIRSQDYFRALLLEQDFPTLSRDSRTLAGLGFCEADAKRLGKQLSEVGVLVYVSCAERNKAESAVELMRRAGAWEAASVQRSKAARGAV